MYPLETLLSPFTLGGIVGTTLSMTFFSIFQNSKLSRIWMGFKYFSLVAAVFFVFSYFFTIGYIFFQIEFLLMISLLLLLVAGIFLFISILCIFLTHIFEDVINHIENTPQLNEIFHSAE